jgi:acetylornithine/N-succinyldiaminopimelate aminotransferase
MHVSNLYGSPQGEALAQRIVDNSFADTVFFTNSGVEAIECAIKTARRYHFANGNPQRHKLITFKNAFHGRSLGAISATDQAKMRDGFEPLLPGFDYAKFNDLEAALALIDDETAGFLVETVQGEGGMTAGTPEFIQGLRKACDDHGLLLILDEIQCGYGRTGKMWAYEHYGITPDILTSAKGIGGGFPFGACLATEEAAKGMVVGNAWFDLWRQPAGNGGGSGDPRRDA